MCASLLLAGWDPVKYRRTDWFIQDGPWPHTAGIIKDWFDDSQKQIFQRLIW